MDLTSEQADLIEIFTGGVYLGGNISGHTAESAMPKIGKSKLNLT